MPTHPDPIRSVAILGTGLIGASAGLALRACGFAGPILGWDPDASALAQAVACGAVDSTAVDDALAIARQADLILLAGPVLTIAEWLARLAPVLTPSQLVTDVGSVKSFLVERVHPLYNHPGQPGWLPGHPMAGKEHAGAAHADAALFQGAAWLFTPAHPTAATPPAAAAPSRSAVVTETTSRPQPDSLHSTESTSQAEANASPAPHGQTQPGANATTAPYDRTQPEPNAGPEPDGQTQSETDATTAPGNQPEAAAQALPTHPLAAHWIEWTRRFGAHPIPLTAERHDTLCAAISHLPQMLATALSAMLGDTLAPELDNRTLQQIGGRALREMTRLGASPYSMWRDIALTNQPAVAAALLALEQQLVHLRENLKTAELRTLFQEANHFRDTLTRP